MNNTHLSSLGSRRASSVSEVPISGDRFAPESRASQPEHVPGDVLAGKYEIVSLLGQGGMGTVWRARSLVLDIDIALKVLHGDAVDSQAAQRLLREARATASVGHPSIVRAFDFGKTAAGEHFLVMELLEGKSLASWLDLKGRMSATQAVQMLLPVASGLAAAHARGIVHRDIKPENIIIVPDGASNYLPKIVDFGIAKVAQRDGQVLTQAGMVLGSLEYMSPEQAEGKQEVGEQTDVWALCVVLYELITGHRPFEGKTISAMIYALYALDPLPTTEFAAGDEELWGIIRRGLEKSPENRWATMLDLGRALASWAARRGLTVDAAGTSLTHHWLAPEAAGVMLTSPAHTDFAPCWTRVSLPSIDPGMRTESQPAIIELPVGARERASSVSGRRVVASRSARRMTPPVFGAVVAFLVAAVAVTATLYASTSNSAPTLAEKQVATAATVSGPGDAWPTTEPAVVPSSVAAPKVAEVAPQVSRARDSKPGPSALPKRPSNAMPLPAAPNF